MSWLNFIARYLQGMILLRAQTMTFQPPGTIRSVAAKVDLKMRAQNFASKTSGSNPTMENARSPFMRTSKRVPSGDQPWLEAK